MQKFRHFRQKQLSTVAKCDKGSYSSYQLLCSAIQAVAVIMHRAGNASLSPWKKIPSPWSDLWYIEPRHIFKLSIGSKPICYGRQARWSSKFLLILINKKGHLLPGGTGCWQSSAGLDDRGGNRWFICCPYSFS